MIPIQEFSEDARKARFVIAPRNAAMCMSDEDVIALADGLSSAPFDQIVSSFSLLAGRADTRLLNRLRGLFNEAPFYTYAPVILAHTVRSYAKHGPLTADDVTASLKQIGIDVDTTDPAWKQIGPSSTLEGISAVINNEAVKSILKVLGKTALDYGATTALGPFGTLLGPAFTAGTNLLGP